MPHTRAQQALMETLGRTQSQLLEAQARNEALEMFVDMYRADIREMQTRIGDLQRRLEHANNTASLQSMAQSGLHMAAAQPRIVRQCEIMRKTLFEIVKEQAEETSVPTIRWEEEPKPATEHFECVVCKANQPQLLYQPCNHMAVCITCHQRVRNCPICQADFSTVIHPFIT